MLEMNVGADEQLMAGFLQLLPFSSCCSLDISFVVFGVADSFNLCKRDVAVILKSHRVVKFYMEEKQIIKKEGTRKRPQCVEGS